MEQPIVARFGTSQSKQASHKHHCGYRRSPLLSPNLGAASSVQRAPHTLTHECVLHAVCCAWLSQALSERDERGLTPLHHAATWGHVGAMDALLEYGADATATNPRGYTVGACSRPLQCVQPSLHSAAQWLVFCCRGSHVYPYHAVSHHPAAEDRGVRHHVRGVRRSSCCSLICARPNVNCVLYARCTAAPPHGGNVGPDRMHRQAGNG